jgi:hypothetical protein
VVYSAQNHAPSLHQDYYYLQIDRNEHPLETYHLRVLSGMLNIISEPTVRLAQTVHLSYTDTNTVSKHTEMRSHMTHVT